MGEAPGCIRSGPGGAYSLMKKMRGPTKGGPVFSYRLDSSMNREPFLNAECVPCNGSSQLLLLRTAQRHYRALFRQALLTFIKELAPLPRRDRPSAHPGWLQDLSATRPAASACPMSGRPPTVSSAGFRPCAASSAGSPQSPAPYFFCQRKLVYSEVPIFRQTSARRVPIPARLRAKAIGLSADFDFFVFWQAQFSRMRSRRALGIASSAPFSRRHAAPDSPADERTRSKIDRDSSRPSRGEAQAPSSVLPLPAGAARSCPAFQPTLTSPDGETNLGLLDRADSRHDRNEP
jgi:hypothetical protein